MNKDCFINEILQKMNDSLSQEQAGLLKNSLIVSLYNKNIVDETTELIVSEQESNERLLELYVAELYAD